MTGLYEYDTLLGVIRHHKRFPRSVLFARAAQLHQQIEYWLGETKLAQQNAEDQGASEAIQRRLMDRYYALAEIRPLASQIREALYALE